MSKITEAKEILKNLGFDVDKIVDFQSVKEKIEYLKFFVVLQVLQRTR